MWLFLAGVAIGVWGGLLVSALCRAARLEDADWDRLYRGNRRRRNVD